MIYKCTICGKKSSTETDTIIRGKVICNSCWNFILSIDGVSEFFRLSALTDKNYSDNQIQDQTSIAKAILSSSSIQSSEKSFPIKSDLYAREGQKKLRRRTPEQRAEFSRKLMQSSYKKFRSKVQPITCPKSVQEIINYWNLSGLYSPKQGTKIHNENVRQLKRVMRGTLPVCEGRKFTTKEIIDSIQNFCLAATNPHYHPPAGTNFKNSLSRTPLAHFIYSPYTGKSYLIEYMQKPKLVENAGVPDDDHPEITKYFANFYIREVLGGIKPRNGLGMIDMQHFVRASERTADFYKRNRDKMELEGAGIYTLRLVTEALTESVNGDLHKLSPGWFSSDAMFNRRLPTFLYKNSMIEDRREF